MNNYIYTNSNLLKKKINNIIENSFIKEKKMNCNKCNKQFTIIYFYSIDKKINSNSKKKLKITDLDLHMFDDHNMINIRLYDEINNLKISNDLLNYYLLNTNGFHIIDGLYEEGSKKIYIENTKNIFTSNKLRYSEHSGFIYFKDNKIDKIVILNNSRTDSNDPVIYLPKNSVEAFNVNYIFHTHPKTPYIGSRMIYEFPSLSDILHFIDHYNDGILIGSIVIAPEGLYIIRPRNINSNRNKIKIDHNIFVNKLKDIYNDCFYNSIKKFDYLSLTKNKVDNYVKIPDDLFYTKIVNDFTFINYINNYLTKFNIFIDYYPRIKLGNTDNWVFPNIYIPHI
jgi:hypothetical protein